MPTSCRLPKAKPCSAKAPQKKKLCVGVAANDHLAKTSCARFLKTCLSPSQVSSKHTMKRTIGIKQDSLPLRENLVRTRLDRPHSGQAAVTVMVQSVLDLLATRRDPK